LLAGIENICILIVPVPGKLMHRRFVILDKVLAAPSFSIQRLSKGKTIAKNIRAFIKSIVFNTASKKIELAVRQTPEGSTRPTDIITHVLGFNTEEGLQIRVVKTRTLLI